MHSQIRTGITRQQRPYHNKPVQSTIAEQIEQKESKSECIGGMTGRKAVSSAPIPIYYMYELRNGVLRIGRTQTAHPRTDEGRSYLVGKNDCQRNGYSAL